MAAIGLAIVGKNNSPLYVREFLSAQNGEDCDDEAVLFGLKSRSNTEQPPASTGCWFVLHAALDRMEQFTVTPDGKKKTTNNYVGLLTPVEETRVYGYRTNTQTKFLLIVEDQGPNFIETTDAEIQQLFQEVHELYVREVMNPFRGNTDCEDMASSAPNRLSRQFDERIQKHIANFNQTEI